MTTRNIVLAPETPLNLYIDPKRFQQLSPETLDELDKIKIYVALKG